MIWLPNHLRPDFKTIADVRRDNWSAFRQVFREFVLLCRQLDLFGRELPISGLSARESFFTKEEFRSQADWDVYLCPASVVLSPHYFGKTCDDLKIDYKNRKLCPTTAFDRVTRLENEAVLDRMGVRLATRPDVLRRRRESVEHPFGTIKQ